MADKQVESAYQIDFRGLRMPIIAVYHNTTDYPGTYVARVWDVNIPTNVVMINQDLNKLQQDIRKHTAMVWLPRRPQDDTVLIGTWI